MSKYPEVVQQLVSAAVDQGKASRSHILAVADGGNGLREALEAQFPKLTFILDRPHLKQHLYEGAEAISSPTFALTGRRQLLHLSRPY